MDSMVFTRYIDQMKGIELPSEVQNGIIDAIAERRSVAASSATHLRIAEQTRRDESIPSETQAAGTLWRNGKSNSERRPSIPLITRRVLAIAACGGALFVGTAALSASNVLPHDLPVIGNALGALGLAEDVPFALAAYADGTPVAGATNIVESNELIRSVDIGSWSTRKAPKDVDAPVVDTSWHLNLSTVGSNVKSLDVSLPNDAKDMKLSYMERKNGLFEMVGEALTFNPTRMNANNMQLNFTLPLEGALAKLNDAISAQATSETWDAFGDEVAYRAAMRLSQVPITLTATLNDASTVSHTYRISPVDNFKELYRADNERFWASGLDGNEFESTPLFTIEQLS